MLFQNLSEVDIRIMEEFIKKKLREIILIMFDGKFRKE